MDQSVSKTQKKQAAEALQQLGKKLTELSKEQLKKIPMSDELRDAIVLTQSINSFGALRRHMQLIGKLMRREDSDAIIEAYETISKAHHADTLEFHQIELWREQLITGGGLALTRFVETYKPQDIQMLRQLIKKAVQEHSAGKPVGAARALFRHLREIMA